MLSHRSIAAAGAAASRSRYSRPAADCAAGDVVDGQRMAMAGLWTVWRMGIGGGFRGGRWAGRQRVTDGNARRDGNGDGDGDVGPILRTGQFSANEGC